MKYFFTQILGFSKKRFFAKSTIWGMIWTGNLILRTMASRLTKANFDENIYFFISILLKIWYWFWICHFLDVYINILGDIVRKSLVKILKMTFLGQDSSWLRSFWSQSIGSDRYRAGDTMCISCLLVPVSAGFAERSQELLYFGFEI